MNLNEIELDSSFDGTYGTGPSYVIYDHLCLCLLISDLNLSQAGATALVAAAEGGQLAVVELLLQALTDATDAGLKHLAVLDSVGHFESPWSFKVF